MTRLMHRSGLHLAALALLLACAAAATAQPVSSLQVRLVNGARDLLPGSYVELRIYELGGTTRRLPLTHGEGWPRDSTRIIPLTLGEPLDPRRVVRFGLYYRAVNIAAPPWQVAEAEVDVAPGRGRPEMLLATTLSGELHRSGELASTARDPSTMTCMSDADCDDQRACNGIERCAPQAPDADERGCVRGKPVVCPVNEVCAEGRGCVGTSVLPPAPVPTAGAGATPATVP